MEVFLETDRLVLRRFTDADLNDLVDLNSHAEVMRYLTGGKPISRSEVEQKILPRFLWYYDAFPAFGFYAAVEKGTGAFIGWFHLRPDPDQGRPDTPELGYRLKRGFWGNGFATEGAVALIAKAFGELGATRVYAETMAINIRSRRVMEKAGMRFVRDFRGTYPEEIPGDEHGQVEYAVTREEWEADRRRRGAPGGT